jgi:hypothetical protein
MLSHGQQAEVEKYTISASSPNTWLNNQKQNLALNMPWPVKNNHL